MWQCLSPLPADTGLYHRGDCPLSYKHHSKRGKWMKTKNNLRNSEILRLRGTFILGIRNASSMKHLKRGKMTTIAPPSRSRQTVGRETTVSGITPALAMNIKYSMIHTWENISLPDSLKVLAGPAFIAVFSISGVLLSVLSDKLSSAVSRVVLVGLGAATFSAGSFT